MPRFTKEIVRTGTYRLPDPNGSKVDPDTGERYTELELTLDRLRRWVSTFVSARAKGLNIPAPWAHVVDGKYPGPILMGNGGTLPSADKNAGFWDRLWVDEKRGVLMGEIDAPGDAKDPNTPAGKIGSLVKETSIYVRPSWVDGKGNKWEEIPMHIACVTHPIEPGQSNFIPADQSSLVISMSFYDGEEGDLDPEAAGQIDPTATEMPEGEVDATQVPTVITLLGELGIVLPPDTSPANFMDRIIVALQQYLACQEEEDDDSGSIHQPPEGADEKNAPFVMAFTPKQLEALTKATNPETGKPFTAAELSAAVAAPAPAPLDVSVVMSHPEVQKVVSGLSNMTNVLTTQAKAGYQARIEALRKRGVKKEAVDALQPLVEGFVMSFVDGKPAKGEIDFRLESMEAVLPPFGVGGSADFNAALAMSHGAPAGSTTHGQLPHDVTPPDANGQMSSDEAMELLKTLQKQGVIV